MTVPLYSGPRFATVMTSVDLGMGTETRVANAAAIASRFSALLIGVAACLASAADDASIEVEEEQIRECLGDAERIFHKAAATQACEWRQAIDEPNGFLIRQAAAADLVVVARQGETDPSGGAMGVDGGAVVATIGRPILVIPTSDERMSSRRVLVAWKNTPEARRAIKDSLPLLVGADEVTVLAIGEGAGSIGLNDACGFLQRHGVGATSVHLSGGGLSIGQRILDQAETRDVDLIVAGAHGRARLREWAFGGVTHELLRNTPCPCLLSH